jgi:hypothetical protein
MVLSVIAQGRLQARGGSRCSRGFGDERLALPLRKGPHWQAFGLEKQATSLTSRHIGYASLRECSMWGGLSRISSTMQGAIGGFPLVPGALRRSFPSLPESRMGAGGTYSDRPEAAPGGSYLSGPDVIRPSGASRTMSFTFLNDLSRLVLFARLRLEPRHDRPRRARKR